MVLDKGVEMKYEQIKKILLTNGYTTQDYKNEILWYIDKIQQENKQLKEKINKTIRLLEIQIEVIKEQPSDNALNDNMEIKLREMVIKSLKEVSDNE